MEMCLLIYALISFMEHNSSDKTANRKTKNKQSGFRGLLVFLPFSFQHLRISYKQRGDK